MSVVGSDYDELKQYNLAEIYDPTSKLEAKTSNGAAPVVADEPSPNYDGIPTEKSEDDKTSLGS